jgi:hemolysin-activating ACP:hemolysin acyltransferase
MTQDSALDRPFRVTTLDPTFDAYGMVLELLARNPPFSDFKLAHISATIRSQLKGARHVAALTPDNELVGFAGWAYTLRAIAEVWVEGRGPLRTIEKDYDALAMTVVVSTIPAATSAMIRHSRALHPGLRGYFKRSYDGQLREPRKQSIRAGSLTNEKD